MRLMIYIYIYLFRDLRKFQRVSSKISSTMKSVGEVMAIGRTFEEALQKAIRAVDHSYNGFERNSFKIGIEEELSSPDDQRLFALANALHDGISIERVWNLTQIDKWFLKRLEALVKLDQFVSSSLGLKDFLHKSLIAELKCKGFSDKQIARMASTSELAIRQLRTDLNVRPFIKQIDTVAAEYPCSTNYLYMTYNAQDDDIKFEDKGVMVLGSGVYRIGSSVEFDWCGVQAVRTLRSLGFQTIMINYNPETVSTDYDEADRLYFENIDLERVLDIYEIEQSNGVVISMGGQTANNIALALHRQKVKILGTSPEQVDNAENRYKFSRLLDKIGVDQPEWKELTSLEEAKQFCATVDFPVLVRPSYVLSGAAMNVVYSIEDLDNYLGQAAAVSREYPVVISKYIEEAKEIEMDGVADNGELVMHVISEHVENAGVHSGDATLILPPQDLDPETVYKVEDATRKIANMLKVTGPFNIQFIAKNNQIKVIECNLRASRSFPFVSKVGGVDLLSPIPERLRNSIESLLKYLSLASID
jgi:carbamoyl-phosphate synthase/aspartate carbamoyltransferase